MDDFSISRDVCCYARLATPNVGISTSSSQHYRLLLSLRPNQLFMPHISILDYVAWPAFREFAVQLPTMQERMGWLMNMSMTVRCDWWSATEDSLLRREETGCMDLCPAAKVCSQNYPCVAEMEVVEHLERSLEV